MTRVRCVIVFLAAAALIMVAAQGKSNRQARPNRVEQRIVSTDLKYRAEPKRVIPTTSESRTNPLGTPERSKYLTPRQGPKLVTDILNGFGGASESDNYRIALSSGGQPSTVGISQSDSFVVKAGFVHASYVMHGDANADAIVDLGDVVYILNYLFKGGPEPCPMAAGDANCDGLVDIGDVVYLLNYLFKGGPPPSC